MLANDATEQLGIISKQYYVREQGKETLTVKKDMRHRIPVEWPLCDDAVAVAIPARSINRGRGLRCGFGLRNDGRDREE